MTDDFIPEASRAELQGKVASSAFVISIDPGADRIDAKIALETGMAVLLGKPIMLLVSPGEEPTPGLLRHADVVVRLTAPLGSLAGQAELHEGLRRMQEIGR